MEEIGIKDITRIADAIFESSGIDFSNYAFSSLKRRIVRFLEIRKIRDLNDFIEQIKSDHSFTDSLVKEITVNVTEMFRDPTFWIVMRDTVLPHFRTKSPIKIWQAACSTGEEVYSMAILLKESGFLHHSKIIATDINEKVLNTARKGIYTLKGQETNNKNYELFSGNGNLSDYYKVVENFVHFDKELIQNVDFISHDLAQDGPITDFDIILCRNVLIYFNFELQEKVIHTFSQSMAAGSFLGIGSKESIRWCKASRNFEEENFEEKIYRKTDIKTPHYQFSIQR